MRYGSMKVTQMPPIHAATLVANSGNTAYGVDAWDFYSSDIFFAFVIFFKT